MEHKLTRGGHKFILAKDDAGNLIVVSMEIMRELEDWPGHQQIFESEKSLVEVLGGGLLIYYPESKRIVIGGKSGTYGQADHNLVKELLLKDERFADYTIKVVN